MAKRKKKVLLSAGQVRAMLDFLAEGHTVAQAAEKFDVNKSTVFKWKARMQKTKGSSKSIIKIYDDSASKRVLEAIALLRKGTGHGPGELGHAHAVLALATLEGRL